MRLLTEIFFYRGACQPVEFSGRLRRTGLGRPAGLCRPRRLRAFALARWGGLPPLLGAAARRPVGAALLSRSDRVVAVPLARGLFRHRLLGGGGSLPASALLIVPLGGGSGMSLPVRWRSRSASSRTRAISSSTGSLWRLPAGARRRSSFCFARAGSGADRDPRQRDSRREPTASTSTAPSSSSMSPRRRQRRWSARWRSCRSCASRPTPASASTIGRRTSSSSSSSAASAVRGADPRDAGLFRAARDAV